MDDNISHWSCGWNNRNNQKDNLENMKKYLVIPGYVDSKNGERHFISARKLIWLYGVDPKDCIVKHFENSMQEIRSDLIILQPDYSGNYSLDRGNMKYKLPYIEKNREK